MLWDVKSLPVSSLPINGIAQQLLLHNPHWMVQGAVAQVAGVTPLQRQAFDKVGSNKNAMNIRPFIITNWNCLEVSENQTYKYLPVCLV